MNRHSSPLLVMMMVLQLVVVPTVAQGSDDRSTREIERQAARDAARERRERSREEMRERQERARSERLSACEKVAAWYVGTDHIPPEVLASRFGGVARGDRGSQASQLHYDAWLLQDARFEPAFGKRYDDMTSEEGKRLHDASRGGCRMPTNERGQAMSDGMLLFRAFDARFQPRYVQAVREIREAHASIRHVRQALAALSPGEEGRQRFDQLVAQRQALAGFLDEKERENWRLAFADAYGRVLGPANEVRVAKAVAHSHGFEGLQMLGRLQAELNTEADAVGVAPPLPPALRERQQALAAELAASERARVDALGGGLVALERGVHWHVDYRRRLGPLMGDSARGRELMQYFEAHRSNALDAAEPELSQRINATHSEDELQALVERYLALPMDQQHLAGTALYTRVAAQRDVLYKRRILGDQLSSPVGGVAQAPPQQGSAAAPVPASGEPDASGCTTLLTRRCRRTMPTHVILQSAAITGSFSMTRCLRCSACSLRWVLAPLAVGSM